MKALVDILREQVEKYRALLEYSKKKQKILIANDIKTLEEILKEERKLIMQLTSLEHDRMLIVEKLSQAMEIDLADLKLTEIADKAPEPFAEELRNIYAELNDLIGELDRLNRENSELVEQALKIVNFNLDILTDAPREVVYGEREENGAKNKNLSRIFDGKA